MCELRIRGVGKMLPSSLSWGVQEASDRGKKSSSAGNEVPGNLVPSTHKGGRGWVRILPWVSCVASAQASKSPALLVLATLPVLSRGYPEEGTGRVPSWDSMAM